MRLRGVRALAATAGVVCIWACSGAAASAATIHVTPGAGDGVASDTTCSLREAVNSANQDSLSEAGGCDAAGEGGSTTDVIVVPAGDYALAAGSAGDDDNFSGDLDIKGRVNITGAGAPSTSIVGNGDRVLDIQPAAVVRVTGVTVRGGQTLSGASAGTPGQSGGSAEDGGGIRSRGPLAVVASAVSGNATGDGGNGGPQGIGGEGGRGGGIYSEAAVTLIGTTVKGNATGTGGTGGASAPLNAGNGGSGGDGGGVLSIKATTLIGSSIEDNTAGAGGTGGAGPSDVPGRGGQGGSSGGLGVASSPAVIVDSRLTGNSSGRGGNAGPSTQYGNDGGSGGAGGGAFIAESASSLTVVGTTVAGNRAGAGGTGNSASGGFGGDGGTGGRGAGITAGGTSVDVTSSRFTGNRAGDGGDGGDSVTTPGTGVLGGAGGPGGDGGALLVGTTGATIARTTFADNATGNGGDGGHGEWGSTGGSGGLGAGIESLGGGALDIDATTISGNVGGDAGTGLGSSDPARPTLPQGAGGSAVGLLSNGSTTTVSNSTFSGNAAGDAADEPPAVTDFPDPIAGQGGLGAAVATISPIELRHVTVASNAAGTAGSGTPGGVPGQAALYAANPAAARVTLRNAIVASNPGGNCTADGSGTFVDGGHNIDFPASVCPGVDADPKLGPLQDNGGPTFTRAIAADGAAFDQVPATGAGCLSVDQRGQGRPKGAACDIGAFELDPPAPPAGGGQQGGQQQGGGQQGGNPGGGNPGPGAPAGDQPAGGGTTPVKLAIQLILRTQRLRTALPKGYSARFDTNEASTAVLELFVEGSATRGLEPAARKRVRVARGSRKVTKAGRSTVTAKFTGKARRALGRRKSVRVLVRLTVTDAAGAKSVKSRRVTLKR